MKQAPASPEGTGKVLYNGRRIRIVELTRDHPSLLNCDYPLEILDKTISCTVGFARKADDGTYRGFIACGMNELTIFGENLRGLARYAYHQILESEKY